MMKTMNSSDVGEHKKGSSLISKSLSKVQTKGYANSFRGSLVNFKRKLTCSQNKVLPRLSSPSKFFAGTRQREWY